MASVSIRIDKALYESAQQAANAEFRTPPQQIALWAMIGRNALANPDLPIEYIYDLLVAMNRNETSDFDFEGSLDEN